MGYGTGGVKKGIRVVEFGTYLALYGCIPWASLGIHNLQFPIYMKPISNMSLYS